MLLLVVVGEEFKIDKFFLLGERFDLLLIFMFVVVCDNFFVVIVILLLLIDVLFLFGFNLF